MHDFTSSKADYFRQIMAENGNNICGRFLPLQMAVQPVRKPLWTKWVSAAMIVLGFNLINQKAQAQEIKQTNVTATCDTNAVNAVFGGVTEVPPEYPAGLNTWIKLIEREMKSFKGLAGKRVIVTFIVNKDGTLSNEKIIKGVSREVDNEILRALKILPKWRPAIEYAKPVIKQQTVSWIFE